MIAISDLPLRWLYVDLNSFFASVEQQEDPSIAGQPVIVTPVDSDYTSAIAVSYEAKAVGIRNGMSVREARDIYPKIHVRCARHDVYASYNQRIITEVDRHIPVHQVCSIDEVACQLTPHDAEREHASAIGRRIQAGLLRNLGASIRCSVGIAPSLLLAKMASDMQKPMGLTVLPASTLPQSILHLSIADIPGVGRRMNHRLERAGCPDMAAFWALSPSRARAIWGSIEGERVWYGLHGIDPAQRPATVHRSLSHSVILAPQHRSFHAAHLAARGLLMRGASRLRQMNCQAQRLDIFASIEPDGRMWRSCSFPPTRDTFELLRHFDAEWRSLELTHARRTIRKTGIVLSHFQKPNDAQPDLFDEVIPPKSGKGEQASRALDQINHRFGRGSVRIGCASPALNKYSGAKIAFTRIPTALDFD